MSDVMELRNEIKDALVSKLGNVVGSSVGLGPLAGSADLEFKKDGLRVRVLISPERRECPNCRRSGL